MQQLKTLIGNSAYEEAWSRLLELGAATTDGPTFLSLARLRQKLLKRAPRPGTRRRVKVALLGGATTDLLEVPLLLALDIMELDACVHRTDYNTFAQEMLDASSGTVAFAPDVAVVVNTSANLPAWPEVGDSRERVEQLAEKVADYWLKLCARLHENARCEIVLNNFHLLPTRPLGNLAAKTPWDPNSFIRRLNLALGDRAPAFVHLNDIDALSSMYGVRQWFDSRYWFHARQPVSFNCLVPYVLNTAHIVRALFGASAKCLVLDLDNTLWGGIVGDDGPEGIRIGEGDPVGEAYKGFQEYVRRLNERGILLAVCSKNDEVSALAPFTSRPEMVLKRENFVAFKANWDAKPDNLVRIAAELNIGLDSLVFVDDNPAERAHVRQRLPDVKVIDLSEDPADYPVLLDDSGLFEITALSAEDQNRTLQYSENAERLRSMESAGEYSDYLATLEQVGVIRPFDEPHLDRITQLVNKSNQFNLTTVRLSRSELATMMSDANRLTAYVRLADRFGDNGLISVLAARHDGTELWIDLWLMSCRVLKRGVEQLLCNHVFEWALEHDVRRVHGSYLPTAKNRLVEKHYRALGFDMVDQGEDQGTRWSLAVASFRPFKVTIALKEDY